MSQTTIGILMLVAIVIVAAFVNRNMRREGKKREEERKLEEIEFRKAVALNPELYYVSEGGSIPDPVVQESIE